MTDKEKLFIKELRELMEKHGVSICGDEEYDYDENPCGTSYSFVGDGLCVDVNEIYAMKTKAK